MLVVSGLRVVLCIDISMRVLMIGVLISRKINFQRSKIELGSRYLCLSLKFHVIERDMAKIAPYLAMFVVGGAVKFFLTCRLIWSYSHCPAITSRGLRA